MEKSALIAIYRSLDKSELRELGKWLDSPTHNQRQDVRDLHHYLLGNGRLHKDSALEKERVWRKLFGKTPYDDAKMRQVVHFALRATEEWLSYRQWQEDQVAGKLALAKQFRRRNLDRLLAKSLRKIEQLQDSALQKDESFFRNEYLLQQEKYALEASGERIQNIDLQTVATALDQTYLIEKLRLCCYMLFHQRVYKKSYEIELLEPVIANVENNQLTRIPSLSIYYYVIKCLVEEESSDEAESEYFGRLRQVVRTHGDVLPRKDAHDIYLMLINLCISKINQGKKAYGREAFEWYRIGLDRGFIFENNLISRYTYLNVVSAALNLQEFDWAAGFIEEYAAFLDEDIREDTYLYAKARYFYLTNNYDATMSTLVKIDIKHPVYNLLGKTMLMKIYYELGEYDALDSLLDSMSVYIRRKDLAEAHRVNFGNVVKFTRRLSRLDPYNQPKKTSLRDKIAGASPLSEKAWLLDQLS